MSIFKQSRAEDHVHLPLALGVTRENHVVDVTCPQMMFDVVAVFTLVVAAVDDTRKWRVLGLKNRVSG